MNAYGPVFIIDDGSQPKIELASKDRDIIAATFTHFLLKNIGGSETFKDKQDFFYHEVNRSARTIACHVVTLSGIHNTFLVPHFRCSLAGAKVSRKHLS